MTDPVHGDKAGYARKKIDLVDRGEDHYAHSNRSRADRQPENRNIQIFNTSLLSEKNEKMVLHYFFILSPC